MTASVRWRQYQACPPNVAVELYTINGGGHTWPDAVIDLPEATFGPTTHEISANDLMWQFFEAHPLGGPPVGGLADIALPSPARSDGPRDATAVLVAIAAACALAALAGVAWWRWRRLP